MPGKLQRSFLFLALAVPFLLILGRALADIAVCLVSAGFLIHGWRMKDFTWLRLPWVKAMAVTWIYLLVSGALSLYDVHGGVVQALTWVRFPLFVLGFGTWLLPLDTNYTWLKRSLILVLSLTCLDTLIQYFTGHSLTGYPASDYASRLTGPFKDKAVVGIFLTHLAWPAVGVAFFAAKSQTGRWKEILPYLLMGLFGMTILLSGERIAFALFLLSALLFWAGAKNLRLPILTVGGLAMITVLALVVTVPRLHDRFITTTGPVLKNFDNSSYGVIFGNAMTAWKLAPVTGVGPKNFFVTCMNKGEAGGFKIASPWEPGFNCARHPHNLYVEWLAETGVIGLGLFLVMIFFWSRQIRQNLRTTDIPRYYAALGFAVSMISFLWPFMTTMSFFSNWNAIIFWWALSLSYSFSNSRQI